MPIIKKIYHQSLQSADSRAQISQHRRDISDAEKTMELCSKDILNDSIQEANFSQIAQISLPKTVREIRNTTGSTAVVEPSTQA